MNVHEIKPRWKKERKKINAELSNVNTTPNEETVELFWVLWACTGRSYHTKLKKKNFLRALMKVFVHINDYEYIKDLIQKHS